MTSFAPIPKCPIGYVADSEGNIYGPRKQLKPKLMGSNASGRDSARRYYRFNSWSPAKKSMVDFSWHRSVYEAFYGPIVPGMVVRHMDGDPHNNNIGNLVAGTQAENLADRLMHGTMTRGERHGMTVLTEEDVRHIRESVTAGTVSQAQLAREFNVSQANISDVVRRRTWAHVS